MRSDTWRESDCVLSWRGRSSVRIAASLARTVWNWNRSSRSSLPSTAARRDLLNSWSVARESNRAACRMIARTSSKRRTPSRSSSDIVLRSKSPIRRRAVSKWKTRSTTGGEGSSVELKDACGGAAEGRRLKNRRAAELRTFQNLSRVKLNRSALAPSGWSNDAHRGLGTRPPPNGSRSSCGERREHVPLGVPDVALRAEEGVCSMAACERRPPFEELIECAEGEASRRHEGEKPTARSQRRSAQEDLAD